MGCLDAEEQLHVSFRTLTQLTALKVEEALYREQCQAILGLPRMKSLSLQIYVDDAVGEGGAGQLFPTSEVLTSLSIRGGYMISVSSHLPLSSFASSVLNSKTLCKYSGIFPLSA